MAFKWLKRRRNTLAADTPPPSFAPPLPSPRHSHFATQQRSASAVYVNSSSPVTSSAEAPKIRRRKSFFQTIGLARDKDKARKRASSLSISPMHFDRDNAPPVPSLPNGASNPPTKLEPAPRKRKSLISRKAPPSAWAGDATAGGAAAPVAPIPPVPPVPAKVNPPASRLPRTGPLGTVQLDDLRGGELPDSPPDLGLGAFTALGALDRLDAIGTLDLGSSVTQSAPSQPSSRVPPPASPVLTETKGGSLLAVDKPLPSPGLPSPATNKSTSLDARTASAGMPEIDHSFISPGGKMSLGAELPQLSKGSCRRLTPEAFSLSSGVSTRTASSSSADSRPVSATQSSSYRKPPPMIVEVVPLPDILNRPTAGRIAQAGVASAVSSTPSENVKTKPTEDSKSRAKEGLSEPVSQLEPTVASHVPASDLPPIMGGPAKIQAVLDSSENKQPSESTLEDKPESTRKASHVARVSEPGQLGQAPALVASTAPELPPIMGGPAKIQGVWESSHTYQEEKAKERADEVKQKTDAKTEDKQDQGVATEGKTDNPEENADHGKEERAGDPKTAATGEAEEIVDDASEASDAQPISTDLISPSRRTSTPTWGTSTEGLVDRPWSDVRISVDAYSPTSSFVDRPLSGYDAQFLGTPTRLPSTQTFGSLPGTSTFGALPRPTSLIAAVEEDQEHERELLYELDPVAESETAPDSARARIPGDDVAPKAAPLPQTPPHLPVMMLGTTTGVPDLYTPDATPPSQQIHTPAQSEPFKPLRSVSTPSKPPLTCSLTRPDSPPKVKELPRMRSVGNLRPAQHRSVTAPMPSSPKDGDDEPTLDDFMTLFRQVQKRGQGVGIRAAAATAEGRELKERRPYGIGLGQPTN
ncbi:hypothetical protein CspeluHIS016_0101500 [Cutaneotrichosporon spelunceum]|uniref:Uncharacterized protein n=1 Tax=Cutaneotrichosporon spelunceum TaxID=1672016 RepID=A0AAD3TN58_9TREE|nr:hypothetical protein CspeluHIS016_0101500 [Cutaneotrichosporon spelunceum]